MKSFWATYLFTALVGTAAAYYGAPAIYPRLAEAGFAPRSAAGMPEAQTSAVSVASAAVRPSPPRLRLKPETPAPAEAATPPSVPDRAPTQENRTTADDATPLPPAAPDIPLYRPPEPDPSASSWAIVMQRTAHYTSDGQNLGPLPAGTVAQVIKTTTSSHGDVAWCTFDRNGQWRGPAFIGMEQLVLFEGPLTVAPPEALNLLHRYFTLKGRVAERIVAIQQKRTADNPIRAAYSQAHEAMKDFDARVSKLTAERDAASGPRRSELINKLHGMRAEQTRLRLERERAAAELKAWNEKNPPQSNDIAADRELAGWIAELDRLEPEKLKLIP